MKKKLQTILAYSLLGFGVLLTTAYAFTPNIRESMQLRIQKERDNQVSYSKEADQIRLQVKGYQDKIDDLNKNITILKERHAKSQGIIDTLKELMENNEYNDELAKAYKELPKK